LEKIMKTKTERKCVVYWIRSPEHTNIREEGYVGFTFDFGKRMGDHALGLAKRLGLDWDTLVKSIIVEFDTKGDAKVYERALRNEMNIGWNRAKGGGGGSTEGVKVSDETRAKISAAGLGRKHSEETRAKMSALKLNISDETRAKISAAVTGRKSGKYLGAMIGVHRVTGVVVRLEGNSDMKKAGFHPSGISNVANGKRSHHKNYIWTREVL
jgi:hypothetical protein